MDKIDGKLILSRSNLKSLLAQLDAKVAAPSLMRRHEDGSRLWVLAEEDKPHYERRGAGACKHCGGRTDHLGHCDTPLCMGLP